MPMSADFEKLFSEFASAIESNEVEKSLKIDEEIKTLFSNSIDREHFKSDEDILNVVEQHKALIEQVIAKKKSTVKQLAQFQKNQKNLKKYQNV